MGIVYSCARISVVCVRMYFVVEKVLVVRQRLKNSMRTRVNRRCLDRVFYGLMHRYDEPGVRTCSHEFYSAVGAPYNPITKCNQKQKRKFNKEENLAKKKL